MAKEKKEKEQKTAKVRQVHRKTNSARVKTIIGVLLIVLAIGGLYFWETIGQQIANSETVVVFSKDVEAGTVVEKSMLGTTSYPKSAIVAGAVKDYKAILGKTTTGFVKRGMQVVPENFEDSETFVAADEKVFPVPDSWVYAHPETVRRGDLIYFYPISEYALETAGRTASDMPISVDMKPVISARIAYVKDGNNREVVDSSTKERYDGSDSIKNFEIITTETDYKKLAESRLLGNVFIIMY